ncbi:MAG: hypothetical protein OXI70_03770 [Chloroflexota bacterium]|nr:hypothetical protein [Chloroflexota bacterium]
MEIPDVVEAGVASRYMVGVKGLGFKGEDARIVVTSRAGSCNCACRGWWLVLVEEFLQHLERD